MSSLPGYTLERYLMWNFDLIVDGDRDANPSLKISEAMGQTTRRQLFTAEEFAPIVALYEPHRSDIERRLNEFNNEEQSWRDYASVVDYDIPEKIQNSALLLVRCTRPSIEKYLMIYFNLYVGEVAASLLNVPLQKLDKVSQIDRNGTFLSVDQFFFVAKLFEANRKGFDLLVKDEATALEFFTDCVPYEVSGRAYNQIRRMRIENIKALSVDDILSQHKLRSFYGSNFKEFLERALSKSTTLEDFLSSLCVWENDRAVKQAIENEKTNYRNSDGQRWETCFGFIIKEAIQIWNERQQTP